jgi:hypothetical protein
MAPRVKKKAPGRLRRTAKGRDQVQWASIRRNNRKAGMLLRAADRLHFIIGRYKQSATWLVNLIAAGNHALFGGLQALSKNSKKTHDTAVRLTDTAYNLRANAAKKRDRLG